jgi:alanine racemase
MVRTGINLYGVFDLEGRKAMKLDPVLTLKAKLIAIRIVPAGTTIGYGRTYATQKPTVVGTVSAGYADGVPLAMSNCGSLLVHGTRCPILGTVSMDYTTISLDSVPNARVDDDVTCLGDAITVAEWAQAKATIPYDIICSFGNRVERRYI